MRFVSAPTNDSDNAGAHDTFVRGNKVLVDAEFNEPVESSRHWASAAVELGDGRQQRRKTMDVESVLHGCLTVRFANTVVTNDIV